MVLLSIDFYIVPFARKLFLDKKGKIDLKKVEAQSRKTPPEQSSGTVSR